MCLIPTGPVGCPFEAGGVMVESNELLSLLLSTAVLVLFFLYRSRLQTVPLVNLFLASFLFMYCGLILTVLEGLFWETTLNILEHGCNCLSSVILAIWIIRVIRSQGERA